MQNQFMALATLFFALDGINEKGLAVADLMAGGVMDKLQLTKAIASVSQPEKENWLGTSWTMTMDLTHPSVTYYSRRHFDRPFYFEFDRNN